MKGKPPPRITLIDYMIGSLLIFSRIKQFYVHDFVGLLSDKLCVVKLILGGNHRDHKVESVSLNELKSFEMAQSEKMMK